jgi:phage anti-repressor protein
VIVSEITETIKDGRVWRSPRTDYLGTLSMGKELAMVENNDRGCDLNRAEFPAQ